VFSLVVDQMVMGSEQLHSIFQNGTWGAMTKTPSGIGGDFHGVSCSSPTFCGAEVDNSGDLAFYINGSWSEPATNNGIGIGQGSTPISCVGTFCMYVSNGGQEQVSINGAGLSVGVNIPGLTDSLATSVSCSTNAFCEAVNTGSYTAAQWNGTGWTETTSFVSSASANVNLGLNAVSCVGVKCTAVDDSNIYTSTGGVQWSTPTPFDTTGEATALSCSTPSFCVAGDYSGVAYALDPLA
jgi:hypothetical protein